MDAWVLYAIDVLFIVAVAAPLLFVILYRWREVPLRREEVERMMKSAFANEDEAARKEAREALDNNPYISDPEETFDRYHSPWRYILPSLILTAITICSVYIVYSWVHYQLVPPRAAASSTAASTAPGKSSPAAGSTSPSPPNGSSPASPSPAPSPSTAPATNSASTKGLEAGAVPEPIPARLPLVIIMALVGGYVWGAYQILARSRASELSPADLYEIDLGMLAAVPVGLAFSLITAELEGVRSFMAFAASAFPLREVSRMVRQYFTRKALGSDGNSTARPTELHLGTAIEGLSDETLARLSELRITTVLDMAYCDPIKVMVQTGFPLPVIVDWVDQSLWALYAGELKTKIDKSGIRCSLDVCEFVDLHLRDEKSEKKQVSEIDAASKEALGALATEMGCSTNLLYDLLFRIDVDPQVAILRKLWYPKGVPKELKALAKASGS